MNASNFLIPVSNHQDIVFDATRDLLYITTDDGDLERFNLNTQTLLNPIDVGNVLNGADITPDGSQLVIAEDVTSGGQGLVHLVDLTDNSVNTAAYTLEFGEIGAWDIAVSSDNTAFVTTDFGGSGWTPLRELDLSTGTFSTLTEASGSGPNGAVRQNTRIQRSADRSLFSFTEPNISSGPIFTYNATDDTFNAGINTNAFLGNVSAVNRDGSIVAVDVGNDLALYDDSFNLLFTVPNLDEGAIFSPVDDILYVVDDISDEIVAYETSDWSELTRFEIGEDVGSADSFFSYDQVLEITDDADFLFVRTDSGIRVIDTPELFGPAVVLADDFDPGIDLDLWETISLGTANTNFTGGDGNALFFSGSGTRQATTNSLDVSAGGTVSFDLIFGTSSNGGENADAGEDVVLEYSLDGANFTTIATYDTEDFTSFTTITADISGAAQSESTQFRWRQVRSSGRSFDNWAIDNVEITGNGFEPPTPGNEVGDDFDPAIDFTFWQTIDLGVANTNFAGGDGNSLFFSGSGTRQAITQPLDVSAGGTVSFDLVFGTSSNGGENADAGEDVVLEYSLDGTNFTTLATYDTEAFTSFTTITADISGEAQSESTQFRWRQVRSSGSSFDNWAIDNVAITSNAPANQAPTVEDATFSLAENSANGTVVGTVAATDPDEDTLTYSITAADPDGDGTPAFAIDSNGVITVSDTDDLDFETTPTFNLTVAVDDGELLEDASVTVDLTDVVENTAPIITFDGTAAISVPENTTAVATITATDADNDPLSYEIASGDDSHLFTIDAQTGELAFQAAPDFEAPGDVDGDNLYAVDVQVSDGNGGTDTESLAIEVTDVSPESGNTGNLLVVANVFNGSSSAPTFVAEYTTSGTLVQDFGQVPTPGGTAPTTEQARDVVASDDGFFLYNGTFDPYLAERDSLTGAYTQQTFAGWSTVNNFSYGGIARSGDFVYVTDMRTFGPGDTPQGIVRFNTSDGSALRFGENDGGDFIDLNIGLDGNLYALDSDQNSLFTYDLQSLDLLGTTQLAEDVRGIAVDGDGGIYGASFSDRALYAFGADGTVLNSLGVSSRPIGDIDVRGDGLLAAGSSDGDVIVSNTGLTGASIFSPISAGQTYIAFA